MKRRKILFSIAFGLAISLSFHNVFATNQDSVSAQTIAPPTCLASHRYATAGGSEKLIHRYEGIESNYWLYYVYGRADEAQQYPMELIAVTKGSQCSVSFWNAPSHDFSYTEYVPLDVAKQFSLAELELYRDEIGEEAFLKHYSSVDRSKFNQETIWALDQLNI